MRIARLERQVILIAAGALLATLAGEEAYGQVVQGAQKISSTTGGFENCGQLSYQAIMGSSVCPIGDLDGDGIEDLTVGAPGDHSDDGSVRILFMKADQTVRSCGEISGAVGNGPQTPNDRFGRSVLPIGDLNADGVPDLLVGASSDDIDGAATGACYSVFLNRSGLVTGIRRISASSFSTHVPVNGDELGRSLAILGDIQGDGYPEIAIGAPGCDDGAANSGAVWIATLLPDGSISEVSKIGNGLGGLPAGSLRAGAEFGYSVASAGDLDGDGVPDLAVGAPGDDRGTVRVLFLNADGSVRNENVIGYQAGGFLGVLDPYDRFGAALGRLDDFDGDCHPELAVGAPRDDDGGFDVGAIYILSLDGQAMVRSFDKISLLFGGFQGPLRSEDWFGSSIAAIGDLDQDGFSDLAVGAQFDDDGGAANRGAVWILDCCLSGIDLALNGTPSPGSPVRFTISGASGELGNQALVLLSRTGTSPGFALPGDGRTVQLVFDPVTSLGLSLSSVLSATVDLYGIARTPFVPIPPNVPSGATFWSAAVTIEPTGTFASISCPIRVDIQ